MRGRRWALACVGSLAILPVAVAAHGASIRGGREALTVPAWLFLGTGGAVIGASFLLASLVTDRTFITRLHRARYPVPVNPTALRLLGGVLGLGGLGLVLAGGLWGVDDPLRNPAIVLIWVVWWPGVTMVTYLLGNGWPAIDPAHTLGRLLPTAGVTVPRSLGVWPATVGLLAIIYAEVVSPLATDPRLLAGVVLAYVTIATAGVMTFGESWFDRFDPIARTFRLYGRVAPVRRQEGHLTVTLPGSGLVDGVDRVPGAAGFVVALLWGTTYDGLVSTPEFAALAEPVVAQGWPPRMLYLGVLIVGFVLFLGVYRGAVRMMRRVGPTFRSPQDLGVAFAASLVPIATGYHFAHYLGDLVAFAPTVLGVLLSPFDPPMVRVLTLPGWFDVVPIGAVLVGHLLAIAVAHAIAYETFPGRLQAVRAQVPLTLVMIAYTVVSLWIVTRETVVPPFL